MKRTAVFFLALLIFPVLVIGETIEHKTEVTIFSGWSFPGIDEANNNCFLCPLSPVVSNFALVQTKSMNSSVMLGFQVGRYLNNKMAVEGSFSVAPNHRLTETSFIQCPPGEVCPLIEIAIPDRFLQDNAVAYDYDARFVYHFASGQVRPYVTAGIGGISFDADTSTKTNLAWIFGGGSKFYLGKNVGLRFEVNDHLIPNHFLTNKTEHDLQIEYGFLFGL